MIFIGPQEKWEHDLRKLSRHALILYALNQTEGLLWQHLTSLEIVAERIADAKKMGKFDASYERWLKFSTDPKKATQIYLRRQAAAKKAARRRKKENKKA